MIPLRTAIAFTVIALTGCMIPPGEPIAGRRAAAVVAPDGSTALVAPACPNWTRSSREDFSNRNGSNFGCADTVNFIGQLAQPSDAVRGRISDGQDGGSAASAVERYRMRKTQPLAAGGSQSGAETSANDGPK